MNAMSHPTVNELDRLRAGLLDSDPASREALTAHLAACSECRRHLAGWQQLRESVRRADGDEWTASNTARALRARRMQALAGHASGAHSGLGRYAVWGSAAVAALVLVVAGVNFRTLFAPPGVAPATMAAATAPASAPAQDDVYADLDFYLWLSKQADANTSNDRS